MSLRDDDLAAWEKWKRTKSPADLDALNKRMNGIIQKAINRWAGAISRQTLEIEAYRLAKMAYSTYSPHKGASLSTHLTNTLQKLSRKVYTHQNIARLPEYQVLKLKTFQNALGVLEDRLSREPTVEELSAELGWSRAAVQEYLKMIRAEHTESQTPASLYGSGEEDSIIHYVYHDLNPQQKLIFEHTTGYGGKPVLSNDALAKKLSMKSSTLRYEKRKLINHISSIMPVR